VVTHTRRGKALTQTGSKSPLRAPASELSRTQISAAISQLEARIRQLYALPVQSISSGDDRKVLSLSHAIEATLDRIYGAGTHQYGLLSKAKDLDATEYLTHFLHNQPPSAHEIRNGIERGRQRAIALLTQEVALMKEQLGDEDCLANRAVRAYSNLDLHPEIACSDRSAAGLRISSIYRPEIVKNRSSRRRSLFHGPPTRAVILNCCWPDRRAAI